MRTNEKTKIENPYEMYLGWFSCGIRYAYAVHADQDIDTRGEETAQTISAREGKRINFITVSRVTAMYDANYSFPWIEND